MVSHAAGVLVAVAGGLATLVVLALSIRSVLAARSQRDRLRRSAEPTFIGGARFHATGGNFSGATSNLTSPYAQLQLSEDRIALSLRDLGVWYGRHFEPPVRPVTILPFAAIENFGKFANGGIRFRTHDLEDERDGLVFWANRRDRRQITQFLRGAGLTMKP